MKVPSGDAGTRMLACSGLAASEGPAGIRKQGVCARIANIGGACGSAKHAASNLHTPRGSSTAPCGGAKHAASSLHTPRGSSTAPCGGAKHAASNLHTPRGSSTTSTIKEVYHVSDRF